MYTRSYWQQRDFPLFHTTDTGKDAAGNPTTPETPPVKTEVKVETPAPPDPPAPVTFTKEQQEFIDKQIGNARVEGRTKAQEEADAKRQKEADDKAQSDLVAKGEFETAKTNYENKIGTLEGTVKERDDLIAKYEALATDQVTAKREELKLPKEWMEGFPEKGTPIDQLAFLTEREKLWKAAHPADPEGEKPEKPAKPRTPSTPVTPDTRTKLTSEEIEKKKQEARNNAGRNW